MQIMQYKWNTYVVNIRVQKIRTDNFVLRRVGIGTVPELSCAKQEFSRYMSPLKDQCNVHDGIKSVCAKQGFSTCTYI